MYRRTLLSLLLSSALLVLSLDGVRACIRCVCVCALPRLPMSFPCVRVSCSPVSDVRARSLSRVRVRAHSCRQHVAELPATADVFVVQEKKKCALVYAVCVGANNLCVYV